MKSLRIGIISGLYTALPPKYYGGIERVVCAVSEALQKRGHDVTLFGPDEVQTSCRTFSYGTVKGDLKKENITDKFRLWKALRARRRSFDVIHNFFRSEFFVSILPDRVPKLISYACPLNIRVIRMLDLFGGRSIHYSVCGKHMLGPLEGRVDLSKWHVVPNPIDASLYNLSLKPAENDPYLIFLSRICSGKGILPAIEVAKKVGKRLVIAGNIQHHDQAFFDKEVKPLIDGKQIQFIGPVDDVQKNKLLGAAEAMLFPILWEEPFGLVVGEAMACGTPVIAFRRGSMPEVIESGKTGFVCDNVEDMCEAVMKVPTLDRRVCRESVVARFSPEIIAEEYEKVYQHMLQG